MVSGAAVVVVVVVVVVVDAAGCAVVSGVSCSAPPPDTAEAAGSASSAPTAVPVESCVLPQAVRASTTATATGAETATVKRDGTDFSEDWLVIAMGVALSLSKDGRRCEPLRAYFGTIGPKIEYDLGYDDSCVAHRGALIAEPARMEPAALGR